MGEPTESHNSLHGREAERAVLGALLVEPKPDDLIPPSSQSWVTTPTLLVRYPTNVSTTPS